VVFEYTKRVRYEVGGQSSPWHKTKINKLAPSIGGRNGKAETPMKGGNSSGVKSVVKTASTRNSRVKAK